MASSPSEACICRSAKVGVPSSTGAAERHADVGRVNGDPAGATAVRRDYWSNKATSLMSDRPSQAGVEPRLWGTFLFDPAPAAR